MRWVALCWCAFAWAKASAAEVPKLEQVDVWIKELGSEEYALREEAEKSLKNAGADIIPHLKEVIEKTSDAETRQRAERIVNDLTTGPRMVAAIKDLDADDWEKVRAGIETLWGELHTNGGVEQALEKAAHPGGRVVQAFRQSLEQLKQQQQQYLQMAQQRADIAERVDQLMVSLDQNLKAQLLRTCQVIVTQLSKKK